MTMISLHDACSIESSDLGWQQLRRVTRPIAAVLGFAAIIAIGQEAGIAMQSPGEAIRASLVAAADDMRSPATAQPSRDALEAVGRRFGAQASIGAELWPHVSVTIHNIDRATCIDAAAAARRIEGLVVVQLEKYGTPAECGDRNDMTWWIMP